MHASDRPPQLSAELAGRQREAGNITDLDLASERALAAEAKLEIARAEADLLAEREGGMELQPQEVAARLSLEGEERAFCSEQCLRRFVAAPQRYSR